MKIALDVDGVLLNWYKNYCTQVGKLYQSVDSFYFPGFTYDQIDHPKFFSNLPLLNGPEKINFDVACYITAMPRKFAKHRLEDLSRYGFPNVSEDTVLFSDDKVNLCKELDIDYIVEDKPQTIKKFEEDPHKTKPIQYMPEYVTWSPVTQRIVYCLSEIPGIILRDSLR